jgi:hypothetical protein
VSLAGGGETPVKVKGCAISAIADGTYPTVFNNNTADGSFGVTSPIYLDNISTDGSLLGTLSIPMDRIVTSFSSKSELGVCPRFSIRGSRGGSFVINAVNGTTDLSWELLPGKLWHRKVVSVGRFHNPFHQERACYP